MPAIVEVANCFIAGTIHPPNASKPRNDGLESKRVYLIGQSDILYMQSQRLAYQSGADDPNVKLPPIIDSQFLIDV